MKILEKFKNKESFPIDAPNVTIAFLGDSVTQGCFEVYTDKNNGIHTFFDSENGYHTKLKKIFSMLYPSAPLSIINGGISGTCSWDGIKRLDRDILRYSPDLCVVCFGLNDACDGIEPQIDRYEECMTQIVKTLLDNNIEVIVMTPNMCCTDVSCHLKNERIIEIAKDVMKVQNESRLKMFCEKAKEVANKFNVPVCDCYSKWENMKNNGVNTDDLLSNHINHPTEDMHWLFAYSLAETIFNN